MCNHQRVDIVVLTFDKLYQGIYLKLVPQVKPVGRRRKLEPVAPLINTLSLPIVIGKVEELRLEIFWNQYEPLGLFEHGKLGEGKWEIFPAASLQQNDAQWSTQSFLRWRAQSAKRFPFGGRGRTFLYEKGKYVIVKFGFRRSILTWINHSIIVHNMKHINLT